MLGVRSIVVSLLFYMVCSTYAGAQELYAFERAQLKQVLGEKLFFDNNLSSPAGQACASCHTQTAGFADPDSEIPVSRGIHPQRFGSRNTPSAAYATFSPAFHFDKEEGLYIGGQFYDGRAKTLKEQAKQPLLNPLEMNNKNAAEVVGKVSKSDYSDLMLQIYGDDIFSNSDKAYDAIAEAIAAFESSTGFNTFSSKYDLYLAGKVELTEQEKRGLKLFESDKKGNCSACHMSEVPEAGGHPLFTDFTYDNVGVPRNENSPFFNNDEKYNPDGREFVDLGLGKILNDKKENGKFKVPTLRNVALTAPYGHNGYFKTLREIVDFYNTRDVDDKWPDAEVKENLNIDEMGDLKLTDQEVDDIVAFMKTLTDGYK